MLKSQLQVIIGFFSSCFDDMANAACALFEDIFNFVHGSYISVMLSFVE